MGRRTRYTHKLGERWVFPNGLLFASLSLQYQSVRALCSFREVGAGKGLQIYFRICSASTRSEMDELKFLGSCQIEGLRRHWIKPAAP
jgi:hypothetical protein